MLWPAIALGALTLYAFDTAVARWRREREFEADRRGSVVSGPEAAASALVRTAVAAPVIHAVLEGAADAPERADADLVAAVAATAAREGFETPQAHLDDRQPHPTDSHPPIRQRLAALQVAPDHPLLARATRPVGDEERAFAPALFADWPALCGDLSRDLLGRMREHDAAVRTVLERTIAAGPAEETPLFENTGPVVWTFGIMAAFLTAAAAATVVLAAPLGLSTDPMVQSVVAAVLLAVALGLIAYAWAAHRRRHEPYLVLTPEGFRSPLLQAPIAWTSVADCRISHDRRLALTVALAPDAPLPAKTRRALKVRVSSRRREVTIESAGVRGLKPQAYAELVGRYLDGARARAMLAGRNAA